MLTRIATVMGHLRGTPVGVLLRIVLATLVLLPVGLVVILASLLKAARWKSRARCRQWLHDHRDAFPDVDPSTLRITSEGGGVCNAGFIWRCRTTTGRPVEYFVKAFLPLGTFWAKICPWLSPFPKVRQPDSQGRFAAESRSRMALAHRHIPMPALLFCDLRHHLTISERLHGEMVHDMLHDVAERGAFTEPEADILRQCGRGLAQIHAAGFSVIDAQPANCMWVPERRRVYFLDLEFCVRGADQQPWDLEFFLTYIRAQLSGELQAEGVRLVKEGYEEVKPSMPGPRVQTRRVLKPFTPLFRAILEIRRGSEEPNTQAAAQSQSALDQEYSEAHA